MSERPEDQGDGGSRPPPEEEGRRSIAEWTTLGISVLILAVLAAVIGYQYVAGEDLPATIMVAPQQDKLRTENDAYYLPVEIRNSGDRTAEDLTVSFSLRDSGGAVESAEISIAFLAGRETVEAVLVFRHDPAAGELTHVSSFISP